MVESLAFESHYSFSGSFSKISLRQHDCVYSVHSETHNLFQIVRDPLLSWEMLSRLSLSSQASFAQ